MSGSTGGQKSSRPIKALIFKFVASSMLLLVFFAALHGPLPFIGKAGAQSRSEPAFPTRKFRVCPRSNDRPGCDYTSISRAMDAARDGDVVTLRPGIYEDGAIVRASGLTIRAEAGAHMHGGVTDGKAALVVKGDNTTIEGLECSEISVGSNGACIRLEGRNLVLRHVYFHNSEMGILSGIGRGQVIIEDSRFEDMHGAAGTLGHSIYIGKVDLLVFRRNQVLRTAGQGHGVKSRARKTVIEGNIIASLGAPQSRAIDIPNGGQAIIRQNVIEQGPGADNNDLIGIALEDGLHADVDHSTAIRENIVICDRPSCVLVRENSPGAILVSANRFVGPLEITAAEARPVEVVENNSSWPTREAAGLAPFPALPTGAN